jgi:alkylresorcinol/alkylpyrone synthase
MSSILGLATANPPRYVTQEEALSIFRARFDLEPAEDRLYERILVNGPIRGRYVGIDSDAEVGETDPDRLIERYLRHARPMVAGAARRALDAAGIEPAGVSGLVVNTCTGYLCPGLSSYVVEDLGLPPSVRPRDLMGMGCGAAIPNLECAADLAERTGGPVLSVAVEVCTATLFMGAEPDLVVSNCIFGDGAAAAVLGADQGLCRLLDFESGVFPEHREALRYRTVTGRLRNTLSRDVPAIGARSVADVADRLLSRNRMAADAVTWWAVHPGGSAVLDAVRDQCQLSEESLRFSRAVLAEYGNMSSPSVLFVLRRILDEARPAPGDKGLLLSFGAGFTAFAALVEF